jgi:hypothetical protein
VEVEEMANVNFPSARLFSFQHDPVMICGSFEIDTGAIVAATVHGDGLMPGVPPANITYNGAGDYTVNLRDRYRHIISAVVSIEFAAGTPNVDLVARVGQSVLGAAAANTIDLHCTDTDLTAPGPVLADPANDNRINFIFILSNSQLDM